MTHDNATEVSQEIEVPSDFLWAAISDFAHIDRWANLKVLLVDGQGVGSRRTVEMESGARVTEELLSCDQDSKSLCYAVLPPNPYSMLHYRSTILIKCICARRSKVLWKGEYQVAAGTDPARVERLLRKVYTGGIDLLVRYFDKSDASRLHSDSRG